MRRHSHAALALMLCLALPSGSPIGVVELVNPEQRFVLISTHRKLAIAAHIERLKEAAPRHGLTLLAPSAP